MSDRPESPLMAVSVPLDSSPGTNASFAVAAPVGAVSRKDRERAGRTSLEREGDSTLVLVSELPGSVLLQRRSGDGTWETVSTEKTSRGGRTRVEVPADPTSTSQRVRVVFSPKNANLSFWVSGTIDV